MRKKTRYIINIILSVVLFFNILTVSACGKQTTESSSSASTSAVDDVGKVSGFMNEYGPTIVILSLFILMAAGMFGAFIYMLKSSNKVILDQQKKLLDTILNENQKKKSSHDKNEDDNKYDNDEDDTYRLVRPPIRTEENLVEIFVKLNETIQESVVELRRCCDADRVSVYVFHNGSYSSHGLPFFKFTCINEKIKKYSGMTPKIHIHNGLPLSMYGGLIADIYRNGEIVCENIDTVREKSPILYGEFVDQGVKSAIANAIYDANDNILGVILTEFVKERDIDGLAMMKADILNTIKHLAPVLSYASYQNTNKKKGDD